MWEVGFYGFAQVWKIVSTLAELTEATEAYAVLGGVLEVGTALIKLGNTVVILAVLIPLFIYMTKNAAGIMVIINDTDQDLVLEDLTCTHGKVVAIFKENVAEENPQPIIPKRLPPIINPQTKKVVSEGSIQAGFFTARKRDDALIGTRGALKSKPTSHFPRELISVGVHPSAKEVMVMLCSSQQRLMEARRSSATTLTPMVTKKTHQQAPPMPTLLVA